jgi:FlaA1/EpsC-like NDP-sugar epimerase
MLNNKSVLINEGTGSFGKKFIETILDLYPEVKSRVKLVDNINTKPHGMELFED